MQILAFLGTIHVRNEGVRSERKRERIGERKGGRGGAFVDGQGRASPHRRCWPLRTPGSGRELKDRDMREE